MGSNVALPVWLLWTFTAAFGSAVGACVYFVLDRHREPHYMALQAKLDAEGRPVLDPVLNSDASQRLAEEYAGKKPLSVYGLDDGDR